MDFQDVPFINTNKNLFMKKFLKTTLLVVAAIAAAFGLITGII